jgi:hypothetical protein
LKLLTTPADGRRLRKIYEMNKLNFDDLIDHASISDWKAAHGAAYARKVQTADDLEAATAAYRKAVAASERAVAGNGDPMAAELTLETATRNLTVARKIATAAEAALARSRNREHIVRGMAHKGVYVAGIRARIAAARAADSAKAALADADRAYLDATALISRAREGGCPDVHGATDGPHVLRSAQEELKHWASRNIDAENPIHPWQPE